MKLKPSDALQLDLDVAWNSAEASLDPFLMPQGEVFAAARPNQSYDFSLTDTNSDLDTTFIEVGFQARYRVAPNLFVTGGYRYLDFEDDAPYLLDSNGSADLYSIGLGWEF